MHIMLRVAFPNNRQRVSRPYLSIRSSSTSHRETENRMVTNRWR